MKCVNDSIVASRARKQGSSKVQRTVTGLEQRGDAPALEGVVSTMSPRSMEVAAHNKHDDCMLPSDNKHTKRKLSEPPR